ncbi:TPA: bifunctional aspartate transaminase/aspartate 4-decarboxylase [Clostridium perfringens]|uniref:bifunctional aspartate transaminase/aspartate 4-decarboxylase n=1 Tax=Clostridium perfringens TaxID=1502 RepID=UPI001A184DEA|nr:bifunctional aspartate transaminase/aspartate 4-decarboxylase [Clostridium perfringens]HAT4119674.1 bifunctional aspartate transaminase/aspartate 4-decarboxylase [Clostridium perfringens]
MITKDFEKKLEELGAFEISNKMLELAKKNKKHNTFLNAGRGNPNWINTQGRLALSRIVEFGVIESRRTMKDGSLAGYTILDGIYERLKNFLDGSHEVDKFLCDAIDYSAENLNVDKNVIVKEFVDGAIANNYPVPSRCLVNTEKILNLYLEKELYGGAKMAKETNVFPTEGGTAAICYIFNSLKENGLIKSGDKIAINTPIFTPYLQIPQLKDYEMVEVDLRSKEKNNWIIDSSELDKLKDENIKALFFVNPSNPASKALSEEALNHIANIVKERKDLIIITDDVYGTFVEDFKTIYSVAPYNTLLVYSFSKLYGATGWRLGLIATNEKNVFDDLISKLPEDKLKDLDDRYGLVTLEPRKLKFIDRLVADSRSVGLYHTSGLSTPQQIQMALFALSALVTKGKDQYIESSKKLVRARYHDLFSTLGVKEDNSKENAKYYSLIDIYELAENLYDKDFKEYLKDNFESIDFLLRLAEMNGIVLMEGVGFGATPGTLRVSEANLPDDSYKKIAKQILELLSEYYDNYKMQK